MGSKQRICGLYKAGERVPLNDLQARGRSADTKPVCARDTERRQWPGTASKHTAQTTEVDPVTVTVEICLGILPCLCQQWHTSAPARPLPPSAVFKALTESEGDKTGLCRTAKLKRLQTQLSLFRAIYCLSQAVIPALLRLCLVYLFLVPLGFSLQRDKAAVEEVAHPRGWKLVSHPSLKAVFTQNIVSMPKHVRGSYL